MVAAATQAISRLGEALNPAGLSSAQRVVQAITEDAQARSSSQSANSDPNHGSAATLARITSGLYLIPQLL